LAHLIQPHVQTAPARYCGRKSACPRANLFGSAWNFRIEVTPGIDLRNSGPGAIHKRSLCKVFRLRTDQPVQSFGERRATESARNREPSFLSRGSLEDRHSYGFCAVPSSAENIRAGGAGGREWSRTQGTLSLNTASKRAKAADHKLYISCARAVQDEEPNRQQLTARGTAMLTMRCRGGAAKALVLPVQSVTLTGWRRTPFTPWELQITNGLAPARPSSPQSCHGRRAMLYCNNTLAITSLSSSHAYPASSPPPSSRPGPPPGIDLPLHSAHVGGAEICDQRRIDRPPLGGGHLGHEVGRWAALCSFATLRWAMTGIPPYIISTARSRAARWSPWSARTARANRPSSKASLACSSRSPAASSATLLRRRTSPTFRRPPRSTALSPSMCMISSPWDCGGTPACSAGWDARRAG
jgi:hypothetical protein